MQQTVHGGENKSTDLTFDVALQTQHVTKYRIITSQQQKKNAQTQPNKHRETKERNVAPREEQLNNY